MKWIIILCSLLWMEDILGQEYHFRQLPDVDEGDVQLISTLYQSSDHMVWLGTDKGAFSFDGRKYKLVARPDSNFKAVTTISESPQGQMWIGYEDGYLMTHKLNGSSQAIISDSLEGVAISKILFQIPGKILIATYGKGVWFLEKGELQRINDQGLSQVDDIYDALIDPQHRLWLATDNGIWVYPMNDKTSLIHLDKQRGLPDEIVKQLELEANGDVWIGLYDYGLARYEASKDTIVSLLKFKSSDGIVMEMNKGSTDDIWIGSQKAVTRYSISSLRHTVKFPEGFRDRLESLMFDRNANVWIASGNSLWIASTQLEFITPGISNIQTLATTNGKIWLGCEQGLYSLDQEDLSVVPYLQKEEINILSIYVDPSGILWIGTFGQGLYIFNPSRNQFRHITESEKISNNSILNVDGTGQKVWLATLGGITEIRWKGNPLQANLDIIEFQHQYNFHAGYVYDVYVTHSGVPWFGTDGKGLYYLDHGQLLSFDLNHSGLSSEEENVKTIYSITSDINENIWISASKGQILQYDLSGNLLDQLATSHSQASTLISTGNGEILMIQEGLLKVKTPFGEIYQFNETNGLTSFEPNINAFQDKDGSVWIADSVRIIHYLPFGKNESNVVMMHFENFSGINGEGEETIRLKPDSNFLDLRFTGLWYQNPADVRYRYMLEGHDPDWIYTQERRAVYSKLAPGTYTFLVAGSHNDNFSSSKTLRKQIIVPPPFYLRWWFIVGITVLILWLLYAYIKARIKRINQLHQLEKEKTTLQLHAIQAQVNPHFLFNSFNTLSSIIEVDQDAAVDYVDQLSGFFRGVLLHRNAELIPLDQEMEIVRNYTYILQKRYGDNLKILENINPISGWIAPLSIQLLVENAIKHNIVSSEKPLTIHITMDDHMITVSNPVRPKMQVSSESTGFGLSSLVTRYQYLTDRKIVIHQEQNMFTVKIPIIYPDVKS